MKNSMQLKAMIKKMSKSTGLSAQLILQNYMLERLLERISISKFHDYFIIKGGFLIASMVGLDTRATMDLDATIKGYPVTETDIREMIEEMINLDANDGISFLFKSIGKIRESSDYIGYRVSLHAKYENMSVPLKIDITTGDVITPKEISFDYKLLFDDRTINVLAYNIETILAEKLETVISRADQNTRPRDYYDILTLSKLYFANIDKEKLKKAIIATSEKRGSNILLTNYSHIMEVVINSPEMNKLWNNYSNTFPYASGVRFEDTCKAVIDIMDKLSK